MTRRNIKKLQNAVKKIEEGKPLAFETQITIYMIKANCSRERAVEMVKRNWEVIKQTDELIPKLELAITLMLQQLSDEEINEFGLEQIAVEHGRC